MIQTLNRRMFLTRGPVVMAGLGAGFSAFSNAAAFNNEILIYIFLRGGIDGVNVVVPLGNDHQYYSLMRNTLAVPDSGAGAALAIGNSGFGFHPAAQSLLNLYNSGYLAIVNAAGTPNQLASRSHFDAEKYMELGTPGQATGSSGWLHRHFDAMASQLNSLPDEILIPIMAFRTTPPTSLLGSNAVLTVYSPGSFRLDNSHWRWGLDDAGGGYDDLDYKQLTLLPDLYDINGAAIETAGARALSAEAIMRQSYDETYAGMGSVPYPADNDFAARLRDTAQLIKLDTDIGLRLVTLDYDGWDTHTGQNDDNFFSNNLGALSQALEAFFDDLNKSGGDYADRTTVIIESEFGRRLYENADRGTDHGNGNVMLAIGKNVNGGSIYGSWPGLYPGNEWVNYPNPVNGSWQPELFEGALSVTTDFRRVISEYLLKRGQHTTGTLNYVFPGYSGYTPLGIFNPIPEIPLFRNDFE